MKKEYISPEFDFLSIDFTDNALELSGEVMGENCNGAQKPIRFREEGFRAEDIEEFYSDSYGDTPMALLAEKSFLVKGEKLIDWGSDK